MVGAGAPALQGEAEGPGPIKPGEEITLGRPNNQFYIKFSYFISTVKT